MARLRTVLAVPFAGLAVATFVMGIDDLRDASTVAQVMKTELKEVAAKRRFARARISPEALYQPLADTVPALFPPPLPESKRRVLAARPAPDAERTVELATLALTAEPSASPVQARPQSPSKPAAMAKSAPRAPEPEAEAEDATLASRSVPTPLVRTGPATMSAVRKAIRARDYAAAADMLDSHELRDDPEAMYLLASLYRNGDGVARDDARAFALMSAAAGTGHLEAEFSLARMYLSGRGVEANREEAHAWLARAAEAGHVGATEALVMLMAQEMPIPQEATPRAAPQVAASDIATRQGKSPLIEAAERGEVRTLGRLLEAGEPADARDAEGRTPLMLAAAGGHDEAVRMLLDRGARPSATDGSGRTPLMHAAARGSQPAIAALVGAGTDPALRDAEGHTASDLAFLSGHCTTGAELFAGSAPEDAETSILEHCGAGELAALDAKGFTFREQDGRGRTPVWYAAQVGNLDAVKFLIGKGFGADAAALSPLLVAINGAYAEIAEVLIANGADIEAETNSGNTPLLIAATRGLGATAELLIAKGADIDHRNADGYSALMLAAKYGREDIVRLLIEQGADASLRNAKRERAVDVAEAAGHAEIANLLD